MIDTAWRYVAPAFALALVLLVSAGPARSEARMRTLVKDNTAFAADIYRKLSTDGGNLILSPYSISTAFAMTYAGAGGRTADQMAEVLRFSLDGDTLHGAMARLNDRVAAIDGGEEITLTVANSLWPQAKYPFRESYLSTIRRHYDAAITPLNYATDPEAAREKINGWVVDRTAGKIENLIPPGVLTPLTRLVLVNAIYFKGLWASPFSEERTSPLPFHLPDGETVRVPTMFQTGEFRHGGDESVEVLELPYEGFDLSMVILLPRDPPNRNLTDLAGKLTPTMIDRLTRGLIRTEVRVFLPRFKITSRFRLDEALKSMGMADAFSDERANFAGMDGRQDWLYIGAALHKAFVEVNEAGTEAAAATGVVMLARGLPQTPVTFRADRPFLFFIRDNETGSILFMGQVVDPRDGDQ
jgi:serpin B